MLSKAKGKPILKIKEISMFTQISNYLKGVFFFLRKWQMTKSKPQSLEQSANGLIKIPKSVKS